MSTVSYSSSSTGAAVDLLDQGLVHYNAAVASLTRDAAIIAAIVCSVIIAICAVVAGLYFLVRHLQTKHLATEQQTVIAQQQDAQGLETAQIVVVTDKMMNDQQQQQQPQLQQGSNVIFRTIDSESTQNESHATGGVQKLQMPADATFDSLHNSIAAETARPTRQVTPEATRRNSNVNL